MMWELMEPCPPGNPKDFTKDPKYHRAVQSLGNSLFKTCLLATRPLHKFSMLMTIVMCNILYDIIIAAVCEWLYKFLIFEIYLVT